MFGLQPTHLVIILAIAVLLFLPSRIPEFGRAMGQTIVELRNSFKEIGRDRTDEPHPQSNSKS